MVTPWSSVSRRVTCPVPSTTTLSAPATPPVRAIRSASPWRIVTTPPSALFAMASVICTSTVPVAPVRSTISMPRIPAMRASPSARSAPQTRSTSPSPAPPSNESAPDSLPKLPAISNTWSPAPPVKASTASVKAKSAAGCRPWACVVTASPGNTKSAADRAPGARFSNSIVVPPGAVIRVSAPTAVRVRSPKPKLPPRARRSIRSIASVTSKSVIVVDAPALTTKVSEPLPPFSRSVPVPPATTSWPSPAESRSSPAPPVRLSSPAPPIRLSSPAPPVRTSDPALPTRRSSPAPPCSASRRSPPAMSAPGPPAATCTTWSASRRVTVPLPSISTRAPVEKSTSRRSSDRGAPVKDRRRASVSDCRIVEVESTTVVLGAAAKLSASTWSRPRRFE